MIFLSSSCAVVTSLLTTYALDGLCDCPPIASANWSAPLAPTTLKAGGCAPPPPPPADGLEPDGFLEFDVIAEILFFALANVAPIDNAAFTVLIATKGIPAVVGLAAVAAALASPVLETVAEIDL